MLNGKINEIHHENWNDLNGHATLGRTLQCIRTYAGI